MMITVPVIKSEEICMYIKKELLLITKIKTRVKITILSGFSVKQKSNFTQRVSSYATMKVY